MVLSSVLRSCSSTHIRKEPAPLVRYRLCASAQALIPSALLCCWRLSLARLALGLFLQPVCLPPAGWSSSRPARSAQELWGSSPLPRSLAQTPEPLLACLSPLLQPHWRPSSSLSLPVTARPALLWTGISLAGQGWVCVPPSLKPFPISVLSHISVRS